MNRGLAACLVLGFVLAGCAGNNDPSTSASSSSPSGSGSTGPASTGAGTSPGASSTPGHTGSVSSGSAGTENLPPSSTLAVTVLDAAAGLVGFAVNATDADGDAMTWRLLRAGETAPFANGTAFPAEASATFVSGPHNVSLVVTDPTHETVVYAEFELVGIVQVVDASYVVASEGCWSWAAYSAVMSDPLASFGGEANETIRVQFQVAPATWNRPFTATFTFDQGYLAADAAFFDAEGKFLESQGTQSPTFGGLTLSGTVPADAAKGVLYACAGPTEAHVHYEA